MPDYSRAFIYKIVSANAPNLVYYGSTTTTKEKRLWKHVSDARPHTKSWCSSSHIINAGAYSIHKIQDAPCASLKELHAIERQFIEGRECVNDYVPGRTGKEYYQANAEKIREKQKAYQQTNKEKVKAYKQVNAEKIREQQKAYQHANRKKIQAQDKARYQMRKAISDLYNISPDLFH